MEKKYPIGGYAPGNYQCTCATCDKEFQGDKQAVQCEPCAIYDKERFDAMTQNEQKELLRRNSMIAHLMFVYAGAGDQIVANQLSGMPLEEAIFQAGYTAGVEFERERKGGLPPLPEPILTDEDVKDMDVKDGGLKCNTGAVWVRASEFKTTAPVYRPYRRKREDGEFDYGEIYVTEDAGDVFLDVDNENTYEPSSFEKWNDYDILFEPNV